MLYCVFVSCNLKLEYLAVLSRASAGGGRLGIRHFFVTDGQKRDYLSRASQRARGATNNAVLTSKINQQTNHSRPTALHGRKVVDDNDETTIGKYDVDDDVGGVFEV